MQPRLRAYMRLLGIKSQKLYGRVTHIWGIRSGQPNRSAMARPRLGPTACVIAVKTPVTMAAQHLPRDVVRPSKIRTCAEKENCFSVQKKKIVSLAQFAEIVLFRLDRLFR